MRRYADRRDVNEPIIRQYLERCGCVVQPISQKGVVDLLVGYGPFNLLMEVKNETGTLTEAQETFFSNWKGHQVCVVRTVSDAKKVLKQYKSLLGLFMAVRTYVCEVCGEFSKKEPLSSEPLKTCPTCGKILSRKYEAPQIVFTGDGWAGKESRK